MEAAALADTSDDAEESGPLRKCAASAERYPVERMIRFVRSPDGAAIPDLSKTLPGRGVWILSDRASIEKAGRGALAKGFKAPVQVSPDLAALIEGQLARRIVDLLGFARRAGDITMGFVKVEDLLRDARADIECLVIASDSGPADRGKLLKLASYRDPAPQVLGLMTSGEIGLAFGRENVVHAALKRGGLAARIRVEADRLSGFRPLVPKDWGL